MTKRLDYTSKKDVTAFCLLGYFYYKGPILYKKYQLNLPQVTTQNDKAKEVASRRGFRPKEVNHMSGIPEIISVCKAPISAKYCIILKL